MTTCLLIFIGAFAGFIAAEAFLRWWDNRPKKMVEAVCSDIGFGIALFIIYLVLILFSSYMLA